VDEGFCYSFHGLDPLASCDSEITSETMNPFTTFLVGESAHRKDSTYIGQHNTETHGHASMPRAGFESTISVFEQSEVKAP